MEFAIHNIRLCWSPAYLGLTGKRKYSSTYIIAGIVMIYVITAACIIHICDMVGSTEEDVVPSNYKCLAFTNARRNPSEQWCLTIKDEENTRSNISWDIIIQTHGSMRQVFAFNTSQSNSLIWIIHGYSLSFKTL